MAKSSVYSFLNVAATLNGLKVVGPWEGDDALVITPMTDIGTMTVGAGGSGIFSQHANRGATISLKLMATSDTHRQLVELLKAQQAAEGRMGFPFAIKDNRNGNGGTTDKAFIQTAPTENFGVAASVREWVLTTDAWEWEVPVAQA